MPGEATFVQGPPASAKRREKRHTNIWRAVFQPFRAAPRHGCHPRRGPRHAPRRHHRPPRCDDGAPPPTQAASQGDLGQTGETDVDLKTGARRRHRHRRRRACRMRRRPSRPVRGHQQRPGAANSGSTRLVPRRVHRRRTGRVRFHPGPGRRSRPAPRSSVGTVRCARGPGGCACPACSSGWRLAAGGGRRPRRPDVRRLRRSRRQRLRRGSDRHPAPPPGARDAVPQHPVDRREPGHRGGAHRRPAVRDRQPRHPPPSPVHHGPLGLRHPRHPRRRRGLRRGGQQPRDADRPARLPAPLLPPRHRVL